MLTDADVWLRDEDGQAAARDVVEVAAKYKQVSSRMLTYAHVCSRVLTYAHAGKFKQHAKLAAMDELCAARYQ